MISKPITINLKVTQGGYFKKVASFDIDSTDFNAMLKLYCKINNEIINYLYLNQKDVWIFGLFQDLENESRVNIITNSEVERFEPRFCEVCYFEDKKQFFYDDLLPAFFRAFYRGE